MNKCINYLHLRKSPCGCCGISNMLLLFMVDNTKALFKIVKIESLLETCRILLDAINDET